MRSLVHALWPLCAAMLAACGEASDAGAPDAAFQAGPPPAVEVVALAPETVQFKPEYPGRTAGSREVEVRARVEGVLLSRHYEEGAPVDAGELLFRIDPAPFEVALARAEARLQQAEASVRAAQRNRDRAATLIEREVISAQDWDDLQSALELAEADRAAAMAEVEAARIDLGYTTVQAPIAGLTSREAVSEGSLVGPGQGRDLLTTIVSTDPLYVWFSYPESELERLRSLAAGGSGGALSAELILEGGEAWPARGEVDFTASVVDQATGTVQARAVFPNPDGRLMPGRFVRVRLLGLRLPDSLLVPQEAVMQSPQGTFVYRVDAQSLAQFTPVRLGQAVGGRWLVLEGLSPGDRVIRNGLLKVQPGQPVSPQAGVSGQEAP